jgi:hypothetical protein
MRPCTPPCVRTGGMQRKACTNLGLPSMGGYHWARQVLPQQQQHQPPCPALLHGTIRSGTPADSPSNTCRCQHGTEVHATGMLHRPAAHMHTHMHATARRCFHIIAWDLEPKLLTSRRTWGSGAALPQACAVLYGPPSPCSWWWSRSTWCTPVADQSSPRLWVHTARAGGCVAQATPGRHT